LGSGWHTTIGLILNTILKAFNHLLAQEAWAGDLLRQHIGKTIKVVLPITEIVLLVNPQATFSATQLTENEEANVTLIIGTEVFKAYISGGKDLAASQVKISGDVDLAQAISLLSNQLRWEAEEDLSRWVGDAWAHRIVEGAKKTHQFGKVATKDLAESVLEYFVHEQPTLVLVEELTIFKDDVRRLRDDIERIEKRIERLLERSL
jgi:ubiquinone biosynthesis protein UbiJ